jgi:hypothetical protein
MNLSLLNKPWVEYWFASQVCVRLCWLTILLHVRPLPKLLQHLTPEKVHERRKASLTLDRLVQIVVRVCHFRLFRSRLFPLACMRQSLMVYSILTDLGYPVKIYFGIAKVGEQLRGHSWVTVNGQPVGEREDPSTCHRIVYSYPSSQPGSAQDVPEIFESNAKMF